MSALTRRAALCGIATLPALGGATVALAAIPALSAHPDAELLALGSEFDALRVKSDAAWWEWQALEEAFEAADPQPQKDSTRDEFMAWVNRRFAYFETHDREDKTRDDMLDQLDGIAKRVRAIEPNTIAGLAVWGRCMARDCMNPGDFAAPLNELDWDKEHIRRFVAVLDKMAGDEVAI